MIMIKITLLASKTNSQEPGYRQCLEARRGDRWIGSYYFASDSDLPCIHKIQERSFDTDSVFVAFQMFRNWQAGNDFPPPDTQGPTKGVRVFDCSCGNSWEEESRDMHSPSGDECPRCEEWVSPVPKQESQQGDVCPECFGHKVTDYAGVRELCFACNGTGREDG